MSTNDLEITSGICTDRVAAGTRSLHTEGISAPFERSSITLAFVCAPSRNRFLFGAPAETDVYLPMRLGLEVCHCFTMGHAYGPCGHVSSSKCGGSPELDGGGFQCFRVEARRCGDAIAREKGFFAISPHSNLQGCPSRSIFECSFV